MDRIDEIWMMARTRGVLAVKVCLDENCSGWKSYLTEAGKDQPVDKVVLFGEDEERVFLLFRYPELYSPTVKAVFNKRFMEDKKLRERYWNDTYLVRSEIAQEFKEQLYREAEAILRKPIKEDAMPQDIPKTELEPTQKDFEGKPITHSRTTWTNVIIAITENIVRAIIRSIRR